MNPNTKKIIALLQKGLTQTEVHKKGYSFATVRYQYRKLFFPDDHAKFLTRFSQYRKDHRLAAKLSPPKRKKKSRQVV